MAQQIGKTHSEKECNTFLNYQYTVQHVSRLPVAPPCKCWNSVPSYVNHNWSTIVNYIRYSKKTLLTKM